MPENRQQLPANADGLYHSSSAEPTEACRTAAGQTLARNGWSFISEAELSAQIAQRAPNDDGGSSSLYQLAYRCAAAALYAACSAVDDPPRLEQGYTELFRYLHRIAARRWPHEAHDIVQRALELTYTKIHRCQSPQSFLTFARFKLLQAAKEEWGKRASLESIEVAESSNQLAAPADVAAEAIGLVELEALVRAIDRLDDRRQQLAVIGKYFAADSDLAIARELGIKIGHVAVLRNRALKRLREDRDLRKAFLFHDPT
jgi:RNA polymerase sigma factor (sigma-70 family)